MHSEDSRTTGDAASMVSELDLSMLRQLVDAADDAVVVVNSRQTIVFFNQGAERIFGYRRDQVVGKPLDMLLPEGIAERHRDYVLAFRSASQASRPMSLRPRVEGRRADGSLFPAEVSIAKVQRDGGHLLGAVVRDVTERTREELLVRAIVEGTSRAMGEQYFHSMVHSLAEGLEMRYAAVAELVDAPSRTVRTLAAIDHGLPVPGTIYELEPGAPCDETLTAGVVVRSSCTREHAPAVGLHLSFTPRSYVGLRLEDANGMPIGLLFAISDKEMPLDARAGDILRVFGARTSAELERQRAQAALVASEASFRSLVQGAPYGICRVTAEGAIRMPNDALLRMLGCTSKAQLLQDVHLQEQLRPTGWQAMQLQGLMAPMAIPVREVTWTRRDGRRIDVRVGGRIVPAHTRGAPFFEMFVEDISDRRALEDSLRQAQKMEAVGQLTGGIAHDFNNLLTIINCAATNLQDVVSTERQDLHVEIDEIIAAARRGADVVRKLLAFARRTDLHVRPIDLAATVRDAAQMLLRFLPASVNVQSKLDETLPAVMVDSGALEHVILNLAKNAADAMPGGGQLELRTRRVSTFESASTEPLPLPLTDYVVLEVKDTGTGMSPEVKARLFEPFYTTKGPGLGSGLGLAMVYGIMRQHQGAVSVETHAGLGTTVRLYLPISTGPRPRSSDVSRAATRDDVRGGSESILLVDDDTAVRDAAQRVLESKGYVVLKASDGIEALQQLDEHAGRVDLIISDVVMPRMGGVELAGKVAERGDRVRVLLTSGHIDESNPAWAELQSLPMDVLRKPWGNTEFLARIRFELDLRVRDRREA